MTVIYVSPETDIIPKPITQFTDLTLFCVTRTVVHLVMYYYNKFNVYVRIYTCIYDVKTIMSHTFSLLFVLKLNINIINTTEV